ncbi:hypothetical protein B0A50_04376 [Salinomyces thailandicus]|uniref:Uncharacterized protein n=1 Tax=Salinomyces thailandicus TaxID=706561 RepID=A0A4U0TZS2_9PEZI|nr:hypothetical protein B0A50_04376 [Salinomyces thailandica]
MSDEKHTAMGEADDLPPYHSADYATQPANTTLNFPPPPQRQCPNFDGREDIGSPIHYTRDPHRLVLYLVPFPKPSLAKVPNEQVPTHFLIYTPPPLPLSKPKEGEKEGHVHKVQRKWEAEIRDAKTGNAKTMSWKGVKGKVTKGINWGIGQPKTSNREFLNRIGADQLKQEIVNTMLRSKSQAQRDAIIATDLLPVSLAIDTLATFPVSLAIDTLATLVWPFGGLLKIDAVWAHASIRGAKTSQRYLAARCHERSPELCPFVVAPPTDTEVLEAIGWSASQTGGVERNWEDEQWEVSEVMGDLKQVMSKGAKEGGKWCGAFEKEPEKALKK